MVTGCSSSRKVADDPKRDLSVSAIPVRNTDTTAAATHNPKSGASKLSATAPRPKIDELIGLDEASLKSMLGEPASTQDAAPSKLWVYRRRQCTMSVTLYPDVETKKFYALNYEVNGNDGSARQQQCITQFASQLAALAHPG